MSRACLYPKRIAPVSSAHGFTLIELMVTVSLIAILLGIGVPAMRTFLVNSAVSNLGNEFLLGASYSRAEAIARNQCVTMCITDDPSAAAPVCNGAGSDWNAGWIIFSNPKCDNVATDATAELLKIYLGDPSVATMPVSGNLRTLRYDSRGMMPSLSPVSLALGPKGLTATRTLCIDAAGRARIANTGSTICSDPSN